ncbi:hypothetical protein HK097_003603 [Rhizophlyctis rosea]|uniref:Uncharacterized protein n=1 Tax=Rhizophlyctis rosea TaxID=64517 RepID=A0AAD5S2F2_9FUNG|nr:hypothetical protein HK097_003603 [Rhizophlyctis rosea]
MVTSMISEDSCPSTTLTNTAFLPSRTNAASDTSDIDDDLEPASSHIPHILSELQPHPHLSFPNNVHPTIRRPSLIPYTSNWTFLCTNVRYQFLPAVPVIAAIAFLTWVSKVAWISYMRDDRWPARWPRSVADIAMFGLYLNWVARYSIVFTWCFRIAKAPCYGIMNMTCNGIAGAIEILIPVLSAHYKPSMTIWQRIGIFMGCNIVSAMINSTRNMNPKYAKPDMAETFRKTPTWVKPIAGPLVVLSGHISWIAIAASFHLSENSTDAALTYKTVLALLYCGIGYPIIKQIATLILAGIPHPESLIDEQMRQVFAFETYYSIPGNIINLKVSTHWRFIIVLLGSITVETISRIVFMRLLKMELEKLILKDQSDGEEGFGSCRSKSGLTGEGEAGKNAVPLVGVRSFVGNKAFGGKTEARSLSRHPKSTTPKETTPPTAADSPHAAADASRRLWATRQFATGISQNSAILSAIFSIMTLGSDYDALPTGSSPDNVGPGMEWGTILWRGFVVYMVYAVRNIGCEILEERVLGVRYSVQAGTLPKPGWNVYVDAVGMGVSSAVGNIIVLQNGLF